MGNVTVVDCVGRIVLGVEVNDLCGMFRTLAEQGCKKALLNLAETKYVDSSGLGTLVGGFDVLAKAGAQLKLLNPQKRVAERLHQAKLDTVLDIQPDEDAAVRSFE